MDYTQSKGCRKSLTKVYHGSPDLQSCSKIKIKGQSNCDYDFCSNQKAYYTVFILSFVCNTGRKSQNKQITGTMNSSRAAFLQESCCSLLAIRKNAASPFIFIYSCPLPQWSQRVCEHTAHPQVYTHQVKDGQSGHFSVTE